MTSDGVRESYSALWLLLAALAGAGTFGALAYFRPGFTRNPLRRQAKDSPTPDDGAVEADTASGLVILGLSLGVAAVVVLAAPVIVEGIGTAGTVIAESRAATAVLSLGKRLFKPKDDKSAEPEKPKPTAKPTSPQTRESELNGYDGAYHTDAGT